MQRFIVTSLRSEWETDRSLALSRAQNRQFKIEKKPRKEFEAEADKFNALRAQQDLCNTHEIIRTALVLTNLKSIQYRR